MAPSAGGSTQVSTSAWAQTSAALANSTSAYEASGNPALAPASRSSSTRQPRLRIFFAISGVIATRRSPAAVSRNAPTVIAIVHAPLDKVSAS
jgi:hypothetical protein